MLRQLSRRAKEQQAVERRRKCPHATVKVLVCSTRRHEADTNPCTGRSRVTHAAGPRRRVERPLHTEGASHQAPKQATLLDQLSSPSERPSLSLSPLAIYQTTASTCNQDGDQTGPRV